LLIKANEALEQLTKRDIGEVKAYVHPPSQVEKVMKALMILSKQSKEDEKKQDLNRCSFV
jgi:alkylhydroperoxidase/carboxymuconolactone decarboxylase family protein YurZ